MKIKSIAKVAPELFLVTYSRRVFGDVRRYVIAQKRTKGSAEIYDQIYEYVFRDNSETLHSWDGTDSLEWMIRNDVEFFDNTQQAPPAILTDTLWPKAYVKPLKTIDKFDEIKNDINEDYSEFKEDFMKFAGISDKKQRVLTAGEVISKSITGSGRPWTIVNMTKAVEVSHKNGRLERDNELKPFFKAFEKYRKNEGVILSDLIQILNNLHPLEKP